MGKLYLITGLAIALYLTYRLGGRALARRNERELARFKEEYWRRREETRHGGEGQGDGEDAPPATPQDK